MSKHKHASLIHTSYNEWDRKCDEILKPASKHAHCTLSKQQQQGKLMKKQKLQKQRKNHFIDCLFMAFILGEEFDGSNSQCI